MKICKEKILDKYLKILYNSFVFKFTGIFNFLEVKYKMVKLRLTRLGRKRVPFYRIAAMEALTRRDGKAIAYLGTFNPLAEEGKQVVLKEEEILRFLSNGAQPTETVKSILTKAGVWDKFQKTKKK